MRERLDPQLQALYEVQVAEQEALLAKANVVGVGIGTKITEGSDTGRPALVVFVSQKLGLDELPDSDVVPQSLGDHETDVIETGEIFAGAGEDSTIRPQALRRRVRPVAGGFSIGHFAITAGTAGAAAYDATAFPGIPQKYYILSNNHVLANSNDAKLGDPIRQPGTYDGGTEEDGIGRLHRFIPMRFGGRPNIVDAAIAEVDFHDVDRQIYWIGYVRGVSTARLGLTVQKTGRTTNYTTGRILGLNGTININYGNDRIARMERQIVTTVMSAPGDSGSLVCDMEGNAVGLLFAGSNRITVANDILEVQRLLEIVIA
jgi:hypothetical protein